MLGIRSLRSRKADAAIFAIVLISAAAITLPQLLHLVRLAVALRPLPYSERRERIMDYYASLRRVKREVPESERVAVIMARAEELDRSVFVASYLYPRPTFVMLPDQYRNDRSKTRPKTIVRVDSKQPEIVRHLTYGELRREQIGDRQIVRDLRPSPEARSEFIVPLVASIDGPAPHRYTTEAVIVCDRAATVTLTLQPGGETKTLTLAPNAPFVFNDLVDRTFGRMARGWLHVRASAPVRAGFWFVNHGLALATPLPLFDAAPSLPQRVEGGERLWIVNTDEAATVRVNGAPLLLDANALWSGASPATNIIEGDARVIAFTSTRIRSGATEFHWPSR